MDAKEVIRRSLEQCQGYLTPALDGLTQEEAAWSPNAESNSIAFILWHMTRVADYHVYRVLQHQDVLYETEGWREKLGTPPKDTGYEYTLEQLRAWPVPELAVLRGYTDSVRAKMQAFLNSLTPEKLAEAHHPERSPETTGAVLARMSTHIAFHVGQISYLRGVQRGLNG